MKAKNQLVLGLAACFCGCLDVGLRDEVRWIDGDSGSSKTAESESEAVEDGFRDRGSDAPVESRPDPEDETGPVISAPSCVLGEHRLGRTCVAAGPVSAAVRLKTDEPAEVQPNHQDQVEIWSLSSSWETDHEVIVSGLGEGGTAVELELVDASGNATAESLQLEPAQGPAVVITEVLADPTGDEPAQELVEIANLGASPVDLTGWTIDDNGDDNGDELPTGATLPSGGVALIVAPNFDPALADGAPVPEEALVLRLESSIGTSGLKNSEAETVELRDATGKEISVFAGEVAPEPGASARRRDPYLPDGGPVTFELAEDPSPGSL